MIPFGQPILVGVSIPIGFSIELRLRCSVTITRGSSGFQSLSGFPLSCDLLAAGPVQQTSHVSIPIGFSIELRLFSNNPSGPELLVSIPIGFSIELRPERTMAIPVSSYGFQSLSGFPLSCDRDNRLYVEHRARVSIPIGFSIELRPALVTSAMDLNSVSIPIGFSIELRQCWGTSVIKTVTEFQSLSGFPLSCDS